jgi:hypothetical protein
VAGCRLTVVFTRACPLDAEHYRRKAQHYLTCAHEMTDSNARAALIELAVHYEEMARANKHMAQQHEDILQVPQGQDGD